MRLLVAVGALVLILAFTLPAYAETQSVKVSGDLTFYGVARKDFDLNSGSSPKREKFGISIAEIQVDADLTDNVSTVVRIVNQRNWGDSDYKDVSNYDTNIARTSNITFGHSLLDLGVDLAYVQIKELIFEPITLRIGRQDIWFGRGMIVGLNQVDPGFHSALVYDSNGNVILNSSRRGIGSPELTAYNAFDSVRMTIDFEKYAPFVVDLVYAKMDENDIAGGDDVTLFGVNAGYTFDVYNAEAEAYYWIKEDGSMPNPYYARKDSVHTVGIRGSFMPTEDWVFGGEAAHQFGEYISPVNNQAGRRNRDANMLNAFVDYLGWTKYMYSPKVGAEWIYLSGEHDVGQAGGEWSQWDRMYRGHFPMLIRPFMGAYYVTDRFPGGEDFGLTNQHEFILTGSMKPLDDVTFDAKLAKYYFAQTPVRAGEFYTRGGKDVGTEIDLQTTYDYTEDVTFSLLTAWFLPGDVYDNQGVQAYPPTSNQDLQKSIASEVIGSCKVSF